MFLRNLDDAVELFGSLKGTFVGAGVTAFARIIPSYFLTPYNIVSLRATRDLDLLREKANVFCLEKETGRTAGEHEFNSSRLLHHPMVRGLLKGLPDPKHILLYQNYPELEALAEQEGWTLLSNPASLRLKLDSRAFFKRMIREFDLPSMPGDIYPLEVIHTRDYGHWASTLGSSFVVQLPEVFQGGGKGTFFIHSALDYGILRERLKEKSWRGALLKSVSIHKFIEGTPVSMALCLTKFGLLFTGIQRQLIDLPYCKGLTEDGVFCGHVWGKTPWPLYVTQKAQKQAETIGEHLNSLGYRGIFGIDFLIDSEQEQVYPVEMNPRFTGAFPMISLLHLRRRVIPMEVFHILEFLGVEYGIDPEELNAGYAYPVSGSHLLLFLLSEKNRDSMDRLDAGLYEYHSGKGSFHFVRKAFDYRHIENERQFIITDGPPAGIGEESGSSDPLFRQCRLLFSHPVTGNDGSLKFLPRRAVDWAYGSMENSE